MTPKKQASVMDKTENRKTFMTVMTVMKTAIKIMKEMKGVIRKLKTTTLKRQAAQMKNKMTV